MVKRHLFRTPLSLNKNWINGALSTTHWGIRHKLSWCRSHRTSLHLLIPQGWKRCSHSSGGIRHHPSHTGPSLCPRTCRITCTLPRPLGISPDVSLKSALLPYKWTVLPHYSIVGFYHPLGVTVVTSSPLFFLWVFTMV